MTFLEQCIQDSIPLWETCLDTPFLKGLADGTLPENCFKGYIVDDSLYLREYARVFAWAMLRAETSEEIRILYSMLAFVNDTEGTTRHYYLDRYDLTDDGVQHLPMRPENRAYVTAMLTACEQSEGIAECMMACLPCLLSYEWIFGEIIRRDPDSLNRLYGRFIRDYYQSDRYERICQEWVAFADRVCADLSEERKARCKALFHSFSEHEYAFWEMSAQPRDDV